MPIVAILYQENSVQTHGTKHIKEFISKLVQGDLEKAIKEDIFNFASPEPDEPLLDVTEEHVPEKVQAK